MCVCTYGETSTYDTSPQLVIASQSGNASSPAPPSRRVSDRGLSEHELAAEPEPRRSRAPAHRCVDALLDGTCQRLKTHRTASSVVWTREPHPYPHMCASATCQPPTRYTSPLGVAAACAPAACAARRGRIRTLRPGDLNTHRTRDDRQTAPKKNSGTEAPGRSDPPPISTFISRAPPGTRFVHPAAPFVRPTSFFARGHPHLVSTPPSSSRPRPRVPPLFRLDRPRRALLRAEEPE